MMTVKQVAEELNVSKRFVYRLCQHGVLKCYTIGSCIRIEKGALKEYLEEQKKGTTQRNVEPPRRKSSPLKFLRLRGE